MRPELDPRLAAACRAFADWHGGEWTIVRVEPSPEARTVAELSDGARAVIAKLGTDDRGAESFQRLDVLYSLDTRVLRVPEPLAWFAETRALLTARAEGAPLRHLDPAGSPDVFARIGRALAELHAAPIVVGELKTLADHMHDLMRPAPEALAAALPEDAMRISAALAMLGADAASWGETPVVPLHRDFHLRQLFDDGEHITVLDWDDAAMGDPAFDVGYLTAYLRSHHGDAAAAPGIAAFLDGYGAAAALRARLSTYERFNALRRACRRFRLQDAGWQAELDAMLARALR